MNRTSLFTHTGSTTNFTREVYKGASIFTIHNVIIFYISKQLIKIKSLYKYHIINQAFTQ